MPIFLIGTLLFLKFSFSVFATDLALQLYAESDWNTAHVEALRVIAHEPENPQAQAVAMWARLQMNPLDQIALDSAIRIANDESDKEWRARSFYELGHIMWKAEVTHDAFAFFKKSFQLTEDQELFLSTAYLLDSMLRHKPELADLDDPLRVQLRTLRPLVTPAILQAEALPQHARPMLVARLAEPIVGLYQSQISPAIGHRCSMHPSCSQYCVEACRSYGLAGIPMTADRLIRESDHVVHRINPIVVDGEERFYNPISDHSFWFRRYRK